MRWVHLASALLWTAGAGIGLWWARSLVRARHRRWMWAIGVVAIVIGAENLLQALAPHHPRTLAHLVGNLALAVAGLVAVSGIVVAGRGIVVEEPVPRRLDRTPLTRRETEVVGCLCEGLDTGEIARRLGISPHTATTHLRNIMKKLQLRSRAEVVLWAVERGLLDRRTQSLP